MIDPGYPAPFKTFRTLEGQKPKSTKERGSFTRDLTLVAFFRGPNNIELWVREREATFNPSSETKTL